MLRFLLEKEFKQFRRNKFLPRVIIMLPTFAMLIFPLAADFEIKNIRLSVIDNDHSSFSRQLILRAEASEYFILTDISDRFEDGISAIESDEVDMILEIPIGFERKLIREGSTDILISANAVNGTKGGLGTAYMSQLISAYNQELRKEITGMNPATSPLEVVPQFRYNSSLSYILFIVPAIMVMVLAILTGFLPALNIVSEKENGTIEQMNVTPVRRFDFIIAKLIPYWVAGFVSLSIAMLWSALVWNLRPSGSIPLLFFYVSLFVLAISGFGLVISNYAVSVQQAMFMMFFFILTFILLSGLYTPVNNMPKWAQRISDISPLRYMIQVLRGIYLKGSGFKDLIVPFWVLTSFAVVLNGWAILSYRKKG